MFLRFNNQNDRRKYGGTAFIELQYCKIKPNTKIKKIVNKIQFWKDDSLYISLDEIDNFFEYYSNIITGGTYSNLKTGTMDLSGVNYYSPEITENIIKAIKKEKPKDYQVLLKWLGEVKNYNGFYCLGL